MALLLAALYHVNHPDPHQLWNPLFHSCQDLFPPSSNVVDDLLDTNSNTCLEDDLAYGNEGKTIASSFQHGLHCPLDFGFLYPLFRKFPVHGKLLPTSYFMQYATYFQEKRNAFNWQRNASNKAIFALFIKRNARS